MKISIKILICLLAIGSLGNPAFAKKKKKNKNVVPRGWHHEDLKKDKLLGVSDNRAYNELLKDKKSAPIIVAVIDGGTDIKHKDLKNVLWVNPKEIADNGKDDDNNGYIDDINGWNYIGGKDSMVEEDTYEATRIYAKYRNKYENLDPSKVTEKDRSEYELYQKAKEFHLKKVEENKKQIDDIESLKKAYQGIKNKIGKGNISKETIEAYKPEGDIEKQALLFLKILHLSNTPDSYLFDQLDKGAEHAVHALAYSLNPDFNPRTRVGDNYDDINERIYGNNKVAGENAGHGTHVAGIIAAERGNGFGIDGIADNAKIMVLRVVPDGDERDKDIANAIRYAVDNGAKIINMSFGKDFSPGKGKVDEAVKYAVSKGVILVHAAGNDSKNNDKDDNFPCDVYDNSTDTASTWIEVGASTPKKDKTLPAVFSNYGKTNVDLFAPGTQIYSTVPDNKFDSYQGTSMAAPVVAGVAAMVWSYFPELTAAQVKQILIKSTVPVSKKVIVPGTQKEKVKMKDLCQSGGVVNAYNAVKMAMEITGKK